MTRKDIIIIAVLANIGVLAIIFMLAFRRDDDKTSEQPEISYTIIETHSESEPADNVATKLELLDEGDSLLHDLSPDSVALPYAQDDEDPMEMDEKALTQENAEEQLRNERFVEVTIKRGDALEKIARANGTTVDAIKKANQLKTDRLKIGQVLQVPVGTVKKVQEPTKSSSSNASNSIEEQYYVIKNGDNPWKIAKQFQIRVDELLKLNDLDEDSARNLKIGDQIRVK